MPKRFNVALVGAGGYWAKKILPNLKDIGRARIAALVTRSIPPGTLRAAVPAGDVLLTRDLDAVLERDDIDGVILATSTSTHFDLALRAIRAGKHVFVEKPPARRAGEARTLAREARKRGVTAVIDHIYLFSRHCRKMDALIRQGAIGEPKHLFSTRTNFGLFRSDSDALLDLGYHDAYLAHWLLRDFKATWASGSFGYAFKRGLASTGTFSIGFRGGLVADVYLSWLSPTKDRRVIVAGTEGILEFRNDNELLLHRKKASLEKGRFVVSDGATRTVAVRGDNNPLRDILGHFVDCARRGAVSPDCNLEQGAEVMRWLERIRASAQRGRRLRL